MLYLPPRFQKAIAFFYIRNNTLFGGLSHPGYKMELNYNKDLVKSLLKEIIKIDNECASVFNDVKNVEFFVSKFHTPTPFVASNSVPRYTELSSGNINLNIKDNEILEIFKKIKEDIEKNIE